MAGGKRTRGRDQKARRRAPRYRVQAPLDVTVLRSGVPDTLPGRSLNLGERGLAAMLAGEVAPGEAVGVEIRLPQADPLRTRALVRNQDKLRCGMEFVGLSVEQQAAIRDWVKRSKAEPEETGRDKTAPGGKGSEQGAPRAGSELKKPEARGSANTAESRRSRGWIVLLSSAAVLLAVLWWRWNTVWAELEQGLQNETTVEQQPQLHVAAEEMQKRVTHRVDPEYPAEARAGNLQGVIVLDVVVGRDGSVVDVHALNGPDVLGRAAIEALRWWRFEPYRVNNQPLVVETTVAVEFKP
jgi:TonB family protein